MTRGKKDDGAVTEPVALLPGMREYLKDHGRRVVAMDPAKALRQRAKEGDAEAQYELGAEMVRVDKWSKAGKNWLRKAAKKGHMGAKRLLVGQLDWASLGTHDKPLQEWTRDLAELGDAHAQFIHAFTQRGKGLLQSWLEKSVAQGYAPAMVEMGYHLANGWDGVPQDMARAVELFRGAAGQDHDEAMCLLGMIYADGRGGVAADLAEALRWIEKPLQKGLGQAWLTRGRIHEASGNAEGFREAMECYRRASDPHHWGRVWPWLEPVPVSRLYGDAAYQVGRLYHDGVGVERDVREAAQWYGVAAKEAGSHRCPSIYFDYFLGAMRQAQTDLDACRKAAKCGNADAEAETGTRVFRMIRGTSREAREGEKWIERSARRGHPLGQYAMGCLEEHHRYNLETEEVGAWYRKSADQGLPEAQAEMGRYYLGGEYWQEAGARQRLPGGEWNQHAVWSMGCFIVRQPDFRQAAEWLRLAAEQGAMLAQFELGDLYFRGDGVEQDFAVAAAWRRRALECTRRTWAASIRKRFSGKWLAVSR